MATDSGTPDAKFLEKKDDASDLWRKNPNQRVSIRERWPHTQENPSEPPNQPLVRSGITRSSGSKLQDGNKSKQLPHHTTSKVNETSGRVGAESKTMVPAQAETTQSSTLARLTPRVRQIPQPAPNQESKDLEINPRQQANNKNRWSYTAPTETTQSSTLPQATPRVRQIPQPAPNQESKDLEINPRRQANNKNRWSSATQADLEASQSITRPRASTQVPKMPQPRQQPSKNNRQSVSIPVETPIRSTLPQTSPQTPPPTPTPVVSKPSTEAQLNTKQTHIDGEHSTTESLEVCTSVYSYK